MRAAVVTISQPRRVKFELDNQPPYRRAWRRTGQSLCSTETSRRSESPLPRVALLGPDSPASLRSRIIDERRLFSADWFSEPQRLRRRVQQHAAGQRRSLAHADHARCHGRICQEAHARQQQGGVTRRRRRDAGRFARGRCLAAGSPSGSKGGFRQHQRGPSRRRLRDQQIQSLVRGWPR